MPVLPSVSLSFRKQSGGPAGGGWIDRGDGWIFRGAEGTRERSNKSSCERWGGFCYRRMGPRSFFFLTQLPVYPSDGAQYVTSKHHNTRYKLTDETLTFLCAVVLDVRLL